MKILFVAAEAAPVAKVGGMGDVVGALPKVLRRMGHDVRIFLPYYGFLPEKLQIPSSPIWRGKAMGQEFEVYQTVLPDSNVPLYLLGHAAFARRIIYGDHDEYWRFTFFANGAAEFVWHYWQPDLVHCHDWHTAMIPVWLHRHPSVATVLTIHNLAYRGPGRDILQRITWCPDYMQGENAMAAGLHFAHIVNTVSPTYACQIQTPEYGEGLHHLLSWIKGKLRGIVNGLDTDVYNPATDKYIEQNFSIKTLERRVANKLKLQEESGLEVNRNRFLLGMVSRLVEQKGIDLVIQTLDRFLTYTDSQFIILGTGERRYESQLWEISNRYPGRVSVQLVYNEALSRRVYSGIDAFVMPSRFEPCGISQLIAMRYGAVPIVRKTGGLADTVSFYHPYSERGTGYLFERYDPLDFYTTMVRAYEGFRFKKDWRKLQIRCMKQDFSWHKSALQYVRMYKEAIDQKNALLRQQDNPSSLVAIAG